MLDLLKKEEAAKPSKRKRKGKNWRPNLKKNISWRRPNNWKPPKIKKSDRNCSWRLREFEKHSVNITLQ